MRTRVEAAPVHMVGGSYRIVYDDARPPAENQGPFECKVQDYYKSITDEDSPKRWIDFCGHSALAFKNVEHIKWAGDFSGSMLSYHYSTPPAGTVSGLDTRYFAVDMGSGRDVSAMALKVAGDYASSCGSGTVFDGHYDRWEALRPTMTTRANMAVFTAELRDIFRMGDLLPKKHFNIRDWKDVFRYANGLHLNYNFGWKPFLKDLKNYFKAVESFDRRLAKFMKNQLKPMTRSKQRSADVSTTSSTWSAIAPLGWYFDYAATCTITRGSSFTFMYEVPHYGGQDLLNRAWADSLGLHLSAKNIWAVLPWSFVVDWFVNVSKFLEQYEDEWLEPWINLAQACSSRKVEVDVTCHVRGPSAFGSPKGRLFHIKYSKYSRAVGAPQFSWDTLNLNADRIRLLASLVASRIK